MFLTLTNRLLIPGDRHVVDQHRAALARPAAHDIGAGDVNSLIRFRDDKDPEHCTWREVRPTRRDGDPTVENLLERA